MTKGRRANGEGSVFKIADGSWRATCPGGKPSFRGATRTEAIRRREEYLRSHRKMLVLPKQARDSFASLLSRWLDSRRDVLRPRTIESYHDTVTRYLIPTIGDVLIGRLSPGDVLKAMAAAKSPRTKNYVRTVCHLALEYALDNDILIRNVARKVSPVAVVEHDVEMPTAEQWTALLAAIDAAPVCTRAMLLVVAFSGLRVGEACGLRWPDYDEGHLRVLRAADRDGNLVPVKTTAGRRVVPVSATTATALDAWRETQKAMKAKHTKRWKAAPVADLMFTTRYGTPWSQRNVLRAAHLVTEKAGLGKRGVHYLRHVAISHLVADPEMDLKTVQVIAGHSSIRVTLDTYGHLIPGRLQKATEAMNRRG